MNEGFHVDHRLRNLGATERYAWLIDPVSPKHFTLAAEVTGSTTIDRWGEALKAVQDRHPIINTFVNTNNNGHQYFSYSSSVNIPLRIVFLDRINDIDHEIKREFSAPFGVGDTSFIKVALLYSKEHSIIIVTSHHSIADGLSLLHFMRDLLDTMAGKPLPPLELQPTIDDLCIRGGVPVADIDSPPAAEELRPYTERSLAKLVIHRKRLSPELTSRLREHARREETTVHGALSAAFAIALFKSKRWSERAVRICTPVDVRKIFSLDYGLSFSVVFPTYSYDVKNYSYFWDLARAIIDDLKPVRTREGVSASIHAFHDFMEGASLNELMEFDKKNCAPDILISNLGVVPFSADIGELTLESLWGPSILIGTEREQAVGVVTLNDTIHLTHTSYQPVADFLISAEEILSESVK
ncbi:condensation domain-containing protein [Serratia rubidaea]|uniref:phthiocerol/phthiodiolone dimycocerosyl transferase family protein n=1 Tax=Serratia rubidaea TaxID=61652 RepID=UPI00234A7839|nr:condensation domain-containing protein [Serratia rubidaea]MDC6118107.1 condensation domain-containing protein [Serratia rubidaea]